MINLEEKETEKDRQCIGLFVVNAEKNVKCLLNRLEINLFFVENALGVREARNREDSAKEILEDLIPAIKKCTKLFVMNVERNARFLSGLQATNRFIVANVLAIREVAKIKVPTKQTNNLTQ